MKTKPVVDRYAFRVTWPEEDQPNDGLCKEFPSLSWLANTPERALRGIRKVVRDVVIDMAKNGEAGISLIRHISSKLTGNSLDVGSRIDSSRN